MQQISRPSRGLRVMAVAAAGAALLAAGCTTVNPYTGEQQTSKVAKGAGIGAAVGAGAGGLAGGGVGYYMDVQEAKLRQQLQGTGVSVTRVGDNITLNMPGNITFATASADLNPQFFDVLRSVTLILKEYDKTLIEVAGHTDDRGEAAYNQGLSERRAASVGQYLRTQGVNEQRIITVGAGETRPIASNASAEGQRQNRRVELTLAPLTAG